jgi:LmbE family N-acetylglucosaminyl deacetylase
MQNNQKILVAAAHPDDEVLGCGATIAKLAEEGAEIHVVFFSDGESSRFKGSNFSTHEVAEKINSRQIAAIKAASVLGANPPLFFDFPDNRLDTIPLLDLTQALEDVIIELCPTLIFTHFPGDLNVDHQKVFEAVLVAARPQNNSTVKEILCFEVPSSTEWSTQVHRQGFSPNYFVDVSGYEHKKFQALQVYESEMREFPHPRSYEAIDALMKWRGAAANLKLAESFHLVRRIS